MESNETQGRAFRLWRKSYESIAREISSTDAGNMAPLFRQYEAVLNARAARAVEDAALWTKRMAIATAFLALLTLLAVALAAYQAVRPAQDVPIVLPIQVTESEARDYEGTESSPRLKAQATLACRYADLLEVRDPSGVVLGLLPCKE